MSDDRLYVCEACSNVTFEPVRVCPACGNHGEPLSLAFTFERGEQ
ncbi:zinc ribbon domain-containing protein [Haloarcula salina]|nr:MULTISPECIES: hypothetical protein [Haloarcula]